MDFADKNVLITGAAGGIGAAICEELLKNGIRGLAAVDIREEEGSELVTKFKSAHPSKLIKYFKADFSNEESLKNCYKNVLETFKNIDIVVNCAGILDDTQTAKTINLNVTGLFLSTLLALEHMRVDKNGKGGVIINFGSVLGLQPTYLLPIYSGTKHAVVGFTKAFMHDAYLENFGVKFVAICPGPTATPLIRSGSTSKFIYPEIAKQEDLDNISKNIQQPEAVGKAIVDILNAEDIVGVWIIENSQLIKPAELNENLFNGNVTSSYTRA